MKKVIIFLAVIIVLFGGLAIMNNMQKNESADENAYGKNELQQSTIDQLDDPNYQFIITPDELEKKLQNEKQTYVYFYSPECSHCLNATPKVVKTAKDQNTEINQFNLLEFEDGWDQYEIESTPTIVVYENGKEVDRKVGDDAEDSFTNFFKKHN